MRKTGRWFGALALLGCLVMQVGCETKFGDTDMVIFHYYEMGDSPIERVPSQVEIVKFKGLSFPLYPIIPVRSEPWTKTVPMKNINEVNKDDLLYEKGLLWDHARPHPCTFIFFEEYWPVDITPLVALLQEADTATGDARLGGKYLPLHTHIHILVPLIPKAEVELTHANTPSGIRAVIVGNRHYPFLRHEGSDGWCDEEIDKKANLEILLTPDVGALNHYYNITRNPLPALELAYPKVAPGDGGEQ